MFEDLGQTDGDWCKGSFRRYVLSIMDILDWCEL